MVSLRRCRAAGAQVGPNPFGSGTRVERGKPDCPHKEAESAHKGRPMGERVKDVGASEGRSVTDRIGVQTLPHPERGQTSDGSWITKPRRRGLTVWLL